MGAAGDRARPGQVRAGLEVLAVALGHQHHPQLLGLVDKLIHGRHQALDQLAVVGVARPRAG